MKVFVGVVAMSAVLAGMVFVLGDAGAKPGGAKIYPLQGDQVYPEGIALQASTDNFYVGSTTDGTIFRGNVKKRNTEVFLPPGGDGRTTVIGMKVDEEGRLFVAGGDTGKLFVYDTNTRELVNAFDNGEEMTFVNDVTLAPDGSAYFTDSLQPQLYRLSPDGAGSYDFEVFLNFEGTEFAYEPGFNANGIAATGDGRYLIVVQSNTGELFRIDTVTKDVREIDLGGAALTNGDGLLLEGRTLYVVRNQQELVVRVALSEDYLTGAADEGFTDRSFQYPTTIARSGKRLLTVNSQFDARNTGTPPELPFNVSSVKIPK